MSLANKTFKNNRTGETIRVIDSFEDIAILENKQKIKVSQLMDLNQYTEQIDPNSFFNNQGAYNILRDKIKNIPTHMIKEEDGNNPVVNFNSNNEFAPAINESAVVMSSEDDERAELARKYGASLDNDSLRRQNDAFAKILGEESDELPTVPNSQQYINNFDDVQRVEVRRDEIQPQQFQQPIMEDPIITMFRKTKRNVEFNISVDISDKIPRLDFIEMMEDSYETSMIDFLADEFTNKIIQDPSLIRNKIKDKIKQLVYGGEIKSTKKEVNDQITDAVTQVNHSKVIETEPIMVNEAGKKTTTRKPRAKKETNEK